MGQGTKGGGEGRAGFRIPGHDESKFCFKRLIGSHLS
jgi:hypothetical protein